MRPKPAELTPAAADLVRRFDVPTGSAPDGPVYHVDGVGAHFSFAYEQLRNAAEYRERHLLLRGAVERFLARSVDLRAPGAFAEELIIELTQAGYLPNHSVPLGTVVALDELGAEYAVLLTRLDAEPADVPSARRERWIRQFLSVAVEQRLGSVSSRRLGPFVEFAWAHYRASVDPTLLGSDRLAGEQALYVAMHQAIFKSDLATTRYFALADRLADSTAFAPAELIAACRALDTAYDSSRASRLARVISRSGAPMRILRELLVPPGGAATALGDRTATLGHVRRLIAEQYALMHRTAADRLMRTIVFIFLTKVIIGVAVEVPYDLVMHQGIAWQPLIINVAFPAVYMLLLGGRAAVPDRENAALITSYAERILYAGEQPVRYRARRSAISARLNRAFMVVYGLGFVASFALLVWILHELGFNLANGLIFFIFFSAVSFLGFRLRQASTELTMLPPRQRIGRVLVDFLSAPFVRVGHWLSDRYARTNLVTRVLDTAIELPLKTSLRLVRQWAGFMRDRQDEL